MELTGTRHINAPQEVVWQALLDAQVLKACVPGCQELTGTADDGFAAVVVQKVGPVKATFKGEVTISDQQPMAGLTISGQGKGGAAGFAKGEAKVALSVEDGKTVLTYNVDAKVGGKLAQLGSRIIDGFAKKMADQFFQRFQNAVEIDDGGADDDAAEPEVKKGWFASVLGRK